jgi:hypothetical protein
MTVTLGHMGSNGPINFHMLAASKPPLSHIPTFRHLDKRGEPGAVGDGNLGLKLDHWRANNLPPLLGPISTEQRLELKRLVAWLFLIPSRRCKTTGVFLWMVPSWAEEDPPLASRSQLCITVCDLGCRTNELPGHNVMVPL